MVEISIVMAYHNRKEQLIRTLSSIEMSKKKSLVEVIIVDDGSDEYNNISDVNNYFSFPIKVIELKKEDKWYSNPCVPYNIGFNNSNGDVIIIQNPECLHVGDIISHVDDYLGDNDYISYAAYSLDKPNTKKLDGITLKSGDIMKTIRPLKMEPYRMEGDNGWYNHSVVRPKGYHFCSAITKENLLGKLNGFDERYAEGIAFDDDELLVRIGRLGLDMTIYDTPMVLHQWHTTGNSFRGEDSFSQKLQRNQQLFYNVTKKEKTYKVNIK